MLNEWLDEIHIKALEKKYPVGYLVRYFSKGLLVDGKIQWWSILPRDTAAICGGRFAALVEFTNGESKFLLESMIVKL
jgi:hypothetical protein